MKPFHKLITAAIIASVPLTIYADDNSSGSGSSGSTGDTPAEEIIILIKKPTLPNKPNSPSRMHIVCYYLDGAFWFEPNFDTAYLDVTVTDQFDIIVADGTVTYGTPLYLPLLTDGTYTVTCATDTDAAYYGTMTVTQ